MSSSTLPSITGTATSPSATANHGNGNGQPSGQSRPLLFFVALGFGVVFTNLWIIVGVKYCFRYNQRARQLAALEAEGGEGLDLNAMPRPRRRREKKLMSMEDVNARFPLTKYKVWRASREQQGLPTAGGITATPSRAGSVTEGDPLHRTSTEDGSLTQKHDYHPRISTDPGYRPVDTEQKDFVEVPLGVPIEGPSSPTAAHEKAGDATHIHTEKHGGSIDEEEDEDDPIRTAVPQELLQEPGDACAICLDSLDDDDEVRGLTCGHAFHASCLDPWLTSRRACCPLCKADYYVPKPRPDGEPAPGDDRQPQVMPPSSIWGGGRYLYAAEPRDGGSRDRGRVVIAGSRFVVEPDRYGFPVLTRESRRNRRREQQQQQQETQQRARGQPRVGEIQAGQVYTQPPPLQEGAGAAPPAQVWLRNVFSGRRLGRGASQTNGANAPTTPGQMEAGMAATTQFSQAHHTAL